MLRVLKDNVLVKIKKNNNEYTTASGIYLSGVEQDFLMAEVVAVPEQSFYYDEDDHKVDIEVRVGDSVVFEKNFHHVYNVEERHRVDHTVLVEQDDEYNYLITKVKDIMLFSSDDGTDGVNLNGSVFGKLYSIMHQLSGTSIKRVVS